MLLCANKIAEMDGCDISATRTLACLVAALLEGKDPLSKSHSSDIYLRLQFLASNKRHSIWRDARLWAQRLKVKMTVDLPLHILPILVGYAYPDHIARLRHSNNYQLSCASGAALSDDDALIGESWLAVGKLVLLQGQVSSKRIEARYIQAFRDIVIDKKPCQATSEEITQAWEQKLEGISFDDLPLSNQAKNWVNRVNMAKHYSPNDAWPDVSKNGLVCSSDVWLLPYLSGITNWQAFENLDWLSMLKQHLSYDLLQKIELLLPKSITLPTGRQATLNYVNLDKVVLSVRMQEMYGTSIHPTIANNRLPLVVELLSPRQQPIQITQDLPNFWKSSYRQVRKDMKSQYPKHYWPEDPLEAEASLKTNRQLRMQGKL
jgi:ATP-dependent helicase HrpB